MIIVLYKDAVYMTQSLHKQARTRSNYDESEGEGADAECNRAAVAATASTTGTIGAHAARLCHTDSEDGDIPVDGNAVVQLRDLRVGQEGGSCVGGRVLVAARRGGSTRIGCVANKDVPTKIVAIGHYVVFQLRTQFIRHGEEDGTRIGRRTVLRKVAKVIATIDRLEAGPAVALVVVEPEDIRLVDVTISIAQVCLLRSTEGDAETTAGTVEERLKVLANAVGREDGGVRLARDNHVDWLAQATRRRIRRRQHASPICARVNVCLSAGLQRRASRSGNGVVDREREERTRQGKHPVKSSDSHRETSTKNRRGRIRRREEKRSGGVDRTSLWWREEKRDGQVAGGLGSQASVLGRCVESNCQAASLRHSDGCAGHRNDMLQRADQTMPPDRVSSLSHPRTRAVLLGQDCLDCFSSVDVYSRLCFAHVSSGNMSRAENRDLLMSPAELPRQVNAGRVSHGPAPHARNCEKGRTRALACPATTHAMADQEKTAVGKASDTDSMLSHPPSKRLLLRADLLLMPLLTIALGLQYLDKVCWQRKSRAGPPLTLSRPWLRRRLARQRFLAS